MDEARRVLERLRRIDALRQERAGATAVLAEVDRLVDEADAWLRAERGDAAAAAATLERLRPCLDRARKAMIAM